jgi:hypothetical protein
VAVLASIHRRSSRGHEAEGGTVKIEAGTVQFRPDSPDWNLHEGTGPRRFQSPDIRFHEAFTTPPTVVVAIASLDTEHQANTRVVVYTADVEADEFNIRIQTWDDSLVYQVWVTWIAFGD